MLNCLLFSASTIKADLLKSIFVLESNLSTDEIDKIDFVDFNFQVGIAGDPRIISNIKGGNLILRWNDDEKSIIKIQFFAQKRYDAYVQELDIPMDIFNGIIK